MYMHSHGKSQKAFQLSGLLDISLDLQQSHDMQHIFTNPSDFPFRCFLLWFSLSSPCSDAETTFSRSSPEYPYYHSFSICCLHQCGWLTGIVSNSSL